PSFIVSQAKGIYKCFGCGKAGNVVGFVMEHEQLTYPESLKYIARKYHIEIVEKELTPEEQKQNDDRESMRILNEYAAKYFQNNLLNSPEGMAIGLSYFRERGFTDDAIKTFGLGYSFEKNDSFTTEALKNGYKLEFLEKTGLTIVNKEKNRTYDRFFGRVMFPIFSISGQVIGFGGRILKKAEGVGKYLNSPESEIYSKKKTLYGLYQARTEIVRQKKCYLVEGYADVISMYMVGVKNVVASSGTSLTTEQIQMIHRLTDDVTVLYDGDSAGIHASIRGINMLLEAGLNIRIVLLPDGEDPDSYAKKYGSQQTIDYLNSHEEDFISFKSKLSKKEADKDPLKRAETISDMVKTIALIDDQIKQSVYIQTCSKILEIDENTLFSELVKLRKKKIYEEKKTYTEPFQNNENKTE
ncbi:MAG: DNA primase, partial [Bacteroidales bacterium]|nr:DNA primase [Bacteroidales bacterium]